MSTMFFSNLQFAISINRSYSNINFKPKQVKCLEAIHCGRDVVAVLPTGYGKSMIFHLLPAMFQGRDKIIGGSRSSLQVRPVVIVVSPLNALIKDQIRRISQGTLTAAALNVKRNRSNSGNFDLEVGDANFSQLQNAEYDIVFTHPEAFLSCKQGMDLFQSSPYQLAVKAVVVDEAHCILEW